MPDDANLFQKLWSSIPGRVAQGALVDPVLGTVQTGAHLVGGVDRLLGHPEWGDPGSGMDAAVNGVNGALDQARRATGQDPGGEDYWRDLGGLISPFNFVAPELDSAILAENAGRLARLGVGAAHDAANAGISAPVDTRSGSYLTGKAIDTAVGAAGGAVKSGLKDTVKGALEGLGSKMGQIVPDFSLDDAAEDISPGQDAPPISSLDPASLPRLTAPDFIALPVPENGVSVPLLEYQPDPAPAQTPVDTSQWGLLGGQYASQYGGGAADAMPQLSGDSINSDGDWSIG